MEILEFFCFLGLTMFLYTLSYFFTPFLFSFLYLPLCFYTSAMVIQLWASFLSFLSLSFSASLFFSLSVFNTLIVNESQGVLSNFLILSVFLLISFSLSLSVFLFMSLFLSLSLSFSSNTLIIDESQGVLSTCGYESYNPRFNQNIKQNNFIQENYIYILNNRVG